MLVASPMLLLFAWASIFARIDENSAMSFSSMRSKMHAQLNLLNFEVNVNLRCCWLLGVGPLGISGAPPLLSL